MKIKVRKIKYDKLEFIPRSLHLKPLPQNRFLSWLVRLLSKKDLKETNFSYQMIGMDKLKPLEPCLILMNHSSFIDLEMAFKIFKKRRFSIVCTDDGFVGKRKLMRLLGCIPTMKFITDPSLVKDMVFVTKKLKNSILMYPEASYSFDGSETPLPEGFSKVVKMLNVPVIMVKTSGAFLRDPLYNNLQKRKVNTSATVKYLISREEIKEKSVEELNDIINKEFDYDHFQEQKDKNILVNEAFRADFLNRVLYKCPKCNAEGKLIGKGITLKCTNCQSTYELMPNGVLSGIEEPLNHIPSWYKWERESVKQEILENKYKLDIDVNIYILKNYKALYKVGTGHLHHDINGFKLDGCDGKLEYFQKPIESYSLYADYYWYEIGDMICIGNAKQRYYCFPIDQTKDVVAKTRLATEEIYKIIKNKN